MNASRLAFENVTRRIRQHHHRARLERRGRRRRGAMRARPQRRRQEHADEAPFAAICRARSGRVLLDGKPFDGLDPVRAPPRRHHLLPARAAGLRRSLCSRQSVVDAREPAARSRCGRYFDRFPILERRLAQHAGTLSGGEKKILSFVRGLAEDQPLVLLDEPSEGVQWENILHMEATIAEKKAAGTAFVVVEQNLAFAERIADRYLVMDQGRAMLEGRRRRSIATASSPICMCEPRELPGPQREVTLLPAASFLPMSASSGTILERSL